MPNTRLAAIDLLRLLAALAVMLHHFDIYAPADSQWYPSFLARYGYFGVELFFVISGFVILMSARGATLRSFATARVVRLYPAFWICCTLTYVAMRASETPPDLGIEAFLLNMTMLPYAAGVQAVDWVYWTLGHEVRFYLFVGLLLALGQMHRIEAALWIWLAATVLSYTGAMQALIGANYAALFIAGCAIYLLREKQTRTRLALLLAAGVVAWHELVPREVARAAAKHWPEPDPVMLALLLAVLIGAILAIAFDKIRLPNWPAFAAAGALSYPLYLLHGRLGGIMAEPWGYVPAMVAVVALAAVVAFVLEKPAKRWLRARLKPAAAASSTADSGTAATQTP